VTGGRDLLVREAIQHSRLQVVRAFVELREGTSSARREMELVPPPVSGGTSAAKEAACFQLLDLACHDGRRDSQGPRQVHHPHGSVFGVVELPENSHSRGGHPDLEREGPDQHLMGANDLLEQVGSGMVVGPLATGGLVWLSPGVGHGEIMVYIIYHINDMVK
jgi:hypothetical protein